MQNIAATDRYVLAIDQTKKRVYNTVFGVWGVQPEMSQFIQDWEEVLKQVSNGYTMLTDATHFRLLSVDWAATTIEVRQKLIEAGITKIAEVIPESTLTKMQFNTISKHSEVDTKIFSDKNEAEAWLDSSEN